MVTTDASDYGVGAVLTKIHADHTEKTVAFASRTLTEAEQNWTKEELIVSSILGQCFVPASVTSVAWEITATDLKELVGNLQYNITRNTKEKCKYPPQVKELTWGQDLDKTFSKSSITFDHILKADVVYHHSCLEELLEKFDLLCQDNTTILWVMRFREQSTRPTNEFLAKFQKLFDMDIIYDFPSLDIKLYRAVRCCRKIV
ncbi:hypothetical protein XELAEV_18015627mg [Xenopus laevis]|uniref:Reverse transcriptase/retrotransposon-derived protein RNase H-like domain-containing protein n=1 Tax=Xenopus laevis TaxID=8355 RepID=A0A974DKR1_XENLA|nr:hypothetical protein XELAEV_18015627mg [Xenopus laevis]